MVLHEIIEAVHNATPIKKLEIEDLSGAMVQMRRRYFSSDPEGTELVRNPLTLVWLKLDSSRLYLHNVSNIADKLRERGFAIDGQPSIDGFNFSKGKLHFGFSISRHGMSDQPFISIKHADDREDRRFKSAELDAAQRKLAQLLKR